MLEAVGAAAVAVGPAPFPPPGVAVGLVLATRVLAAGFGPEDPLGAVIFPLADVAAAAPLVWPDVGVEGPLAAVVLGAAVGLGFSALGDDGAALVGWDGVGFAVGVGGLPLLLEAPQAGTAREPAATRAIRRRIG